MDIWLCKIIWCVKNVIVNSISFCFVMFELFIFICDVFLLVMWVYLDSCSCKEYLIIYGGWLLKKVEFKWLIMDGWFFGCYRSFIINNYRL